MSGLYYANPYSGLTLWSFLQTLLSRQGARLTGALPWSDIASDELQIATLAAVALSGALVGSFLVLRRMAMMANALSHTILLGIVGAYLITALGSADAMEMGLHPVVFFIAATATGLVTAFLTTFLTRTLQLAADASTGLVFTALFALAIVLVTLLTRNAHIGAEAVIGNIDALQPSDFWLAAVVALINGLLIFILYKEYVITTFDSGFALTLGIPTAAYHYLITAQISITTVSGFRAVGVLMVLALFTAPPLAARLLCHSLPRLLALASFIGVASSIGGVALSRHFLSAYGLALSTAGITVCLLSLVFILIAFYTRLQQRWHRRRLYVAAHKA